MSRSTPLLTLVVPLVAFSAQGASANPLMSDSQDLSVAFQEGVFSRLSMTEMPSLRSDTAWRTGDLWFSVQGSHNRAARYGRSGEGTVGYKSDRASLQLGYDHPIDNFRLGFSLLGATGELKALGGDNFKLKPDYYGASLYGAWSGKRVNVMADAGYLTAQSNKKDDNGFPNADVWFSGIKFETRLNTAVFDVVPYYGVRFAHIASDRSAERSFTDANLWQFPLGINVGSDWTCPGGWKTRFATDIAVVPSAGKRLSYSDSGFFRLTASNLYQGELNISATKNNHAIGLKYGLGVAAYGRLDQNLSASYRFMY